MADLIVPWPPRELAPNGRAHWAAKARAAKAYRRSCFFIAAGCLPELPAEGPIPLMVKFHPPDRRARDLDNLLASMKAGLDGLADGWHVNDSRFEPVPVMGEVRNVPCVSVRIGDGS